MDGMELIIKKLKQDANRFYDTKLLLLEYLQTRELALKDAKTESEYDYCETTGRIKELNNFVAFLSTTLFKVEEEEKN